LYVIPERVAATTVLLIPRFPEATFSDLSIFAVANFAAVIVPSAIFVPDTSLIFPSVTAKLAIAPVSTALSASSVAVTEFESS